LQQRWDHFVSTAKNGHFMFLRDYMDYHGDRINDSSLLFENKGRLVGLLPAHLEKGEKRSEIDLVSHAGLSFGGFITSRSMNVSLMLKIFSVLADFMRQRDWKRLIYTPSPYIYHRYPAEEDLYALWAHSAEVVTTKVSCALLAGLSPRLNDSRRRLCRKAREMGLRIEPFFDLDRFYDMVCRWLDKRHGAKPIHSLEEIRYLAGRFPDNIKIYGAWRGSELLAAKMTFESPTCLKLQYVGSTEEGLESSAMSLINEFLLQLHVPPGKWFDLGTSMDPGTGALDRQLITHKESFGARAVLIRTYQLKIN